MNKKQSKPLLVVCALLVLSLVAAFVLFFFFDSLAQIDHKGIKLGGSLAGFVIIFFLLKNTYFKLYSNNEIQNIKSAEDRITYLEEQLKQALMGTLDNFITPKGFNPIISPEFRFGICVPENWNFVPFSQNTMYGTAFDLENAEEVGFARNVVINIVQCNSDDVQFKATVAIQKECTLNMLPNSKLLSTEECLCQGSPAVKMEISYIPTTDYAEEIICYQIAILNPIQKQIITISNTALKRNYQESKKIFDNVLGTLRLSGI